jgi:hypothetical protein
MKTFRLAALLFLFVSCVGHHKIGREITSFRTTNNDCRILFKKQNLQYKLALREGKVNQRRKKVVWSKKSITENKKNDGSSMMETSMLHETYTSSVALRNPFDHYQSIDLNDSERSHSIVSNSSEHTTFPQAKEEITRTVQHGELIQLKPTDTKIVVPATFISSGFAFVLITASGLTGLVLLHIFQRKAMQLSHWAKQNPWKTRAAIGAMQIATGICSLWLGSDLYEEGVMIPEYVRLTGMGLLTGSAIFYPTKFHANGFPAFSYMSRKLHDVGLFTAGAILTVYAGNHYAIVVQEENPIQLVSAVSAPAGNVASVRSMKSKISLVKKEFKERLKTYLQDPKKERTRGEKIGLTIVAVLGFVILTVGVAALSCSIACSGNEAAAVAVAVAGAGLIAWGLTAAIRGIYNYPKKEKKTSVQATS